MNKKTIFISVSIGLVIVAIGDYLLFFRTNSSDTSSFAPVKITKEVLGIAPSTKNWKTYTDSVTGFSIKYPDTHTKQEVSNPSGLQIAFLPPEDKPRLQWKGFPFTVLFTPDANYVEIEKGLEVAKKGAEYYDEKSVIVSNISGVEMKIGPNPNVGNSLHAIYVIIPYKNGRILFNTVALDKSQLEKEAVPLFNAFLSTFQP